MLRNQTIRCSRVLIFKGIFVISLGLAYADRMLCFLRYLCTSCMLLVCVILEHASIYRTSPPLARPTGCISLRPLVGSYQRQRPPSTCCTWLCPMILLASSYPSSLPLRCASACFSMHVSSVASRVGRRKETYSQIEHARFLRSAEILTLGDFGVRVKLSHHKQSAVIPSLQNHD